MKVVPLLLCLFAYPFGAFSQSVESVLARMDQAAPSFKGAEAKMSVVTFTAILSDTTTEQGVLKMQRLKPSDVRAIIDFSAQPDSARVIGFQGKTIKIYYPNTKEVQEYAVGKDADVMNQFLLLGFGSSGKDLKASYAITGQGTETIAAKKTTKLQLIPKDAEVKTRLSQVEIWVPEDAAYPVQQKFTEPSGNYRQVTYSSVEINPTMPGLLELKIPSNAKKKKAN